MPDPECTRVLRVGEQLGAAVLVVQNGRWTAVARVVVAPEAPTLSIVKARGVAATVAAEVFTRCFLATVSASHFCRSVSQNQQAFPPAHGRAHSLAR